MSAPKRKPALTAEQPETVETIRAQLVALKAERTALEDLLRRLADAHGFTASPID